MLFRASDNPEVNELKRVGYHPNAFLASDDEARAVLSFIQKGWGGHSFEDLYNNLAFSDPYMVLADFRSYREAQARARQLYAQPEVWNRMSLMNVANAGVFSADRSVLDYNRDIWGIRPVR